MQVKLLPPTRQTKFVRDYSRTVDLLEKAKESLVLSPYAQLNKTHYHENDQDAINCRQNLGRACACLVQAFPLLTDMRLPV
jgi:hypothetical protein